MSYQYNINGREERMLELKAQVNELVARQGLPARYIPPASTENVK